MNFIVKLDSKFVVALGTAVAGIILASKLTPDAAERVSTKAVDAFKEYATAVRGE